MRLGVRNSRRHIWDARRGCRGLRPRGRPIDEIVDEIVDEIKPYVGAGCKAWMPGASPPGATY